MHSALYALIPALGKLIKEMGRLTLFSTVSVTGLTRAKSGVDAVT